MQEYIDQKKELQNLLLTYIDGEADEAASYDALVNFIKSKKILEDKGELKDLLVLILRVSQHHHRKPDFFAKIDKLMTFLITVIKSTFSKDEILNIFKKNLRILLFLLENDVVSIDDDFNSIISSQTNAKKYFFNELKPSFKLETTAKLEKSLLSFNPSIFEDFDDKRKSGENESYITKLIREDLVEDFIQYCNKNVISLSSIINPSIFETNRFLINKSPSLIEYAAFFGSLQIFQYIKMNDIQFDPNLWMYAIHGNNPQIIHMIEESKIEPYDQNYNKLLKEAIKCHHNDVANYIQINYIDVMKKEEEEEEEEKEKNDFKENRVAYAFHYSNYELFPNDFEENNKLYFSYFCFYDYLNLVKFFVENKMVDINFKNNIDIVEYLLKQPEIEIGPNSFSKCTKLTEIEIPLKITVIASSSFKECISLRQVIIPRSVTRIEDGAFKKCRSLTEIRIPLSVKFIGKSCFNGCNKLKDINIPPSITEIPEFAFKFCESLKIINLPNSIVSIGEGAFSQCYSLKEIEIPDSVISIHKHAFSECFYLQNVTIPDSLKSIEGDAFVKCKRLSDIKFPDDVEMTGLVSFENCNSLKELSIPKSAAKCQYGCFFGCSSLKRLRIPSSLSLINTEISSKVKIKTF